MAGTGLVREPLMNCQLDLYQKCYSQWNRKSGKSGTVLMDQLREALELHSWPLAK